jgi:hypothetical protein
VNHQPLATSNQAIKPRFLQPAPAWSAILGFSLLTLLGIVGGLGSVLNFVFPGLALLVGIFLFFRYPVLYLGFSWWMWFLTPLARRLSDYQSGFTNPSPMLLAPLLVAFVSIVTLYRYLPKATYAPDGLPFILPLLSVFYGLLIGLIKGSLVDVGISFLEWSVPIIFGFHLFANWTYYPAYRNCMQKVFVWNVLVAGTYGVVQYIIAPEWDRSWLVNNFEGGTATLIQLGTSFGTPEPFGIRVWSTMHGPLVFAVVMMAGLLILFSYKGSALNISASVVGYISFLLSQARTAWGGWLVGLLILAVTLKSKQQMRLILTIVVMLLCILPLTLIEPFSEVIYSRLETLQTLAADGSGQERSETYRILLALALTSFLGDGVGNQPQTDRILDSEILVALFTLGVFGTIVYMSGLIFLIAKTFGYAVPPSDMFVASARAIVIGGIPMLVLGSVMSGLPGTIIWSFLGLALASQKYYIYQTVSRRDALNS